MIINILQELPTIQNYEDLGLKSFLIFVILILGAVIWKLYNKKELREKELQEEIQTTSKELQEKIDQIYKEHKDDLKLANNDYKLLSEKFFTFSNQIKDLVRK